MTFGNEKNQTVPETMFFELKGESFGQNEFA